MPSQRARAAAGQAVKAFLADVASHYLGRTYDHKRNPWGKKVWATILDMWDDRCASWNTPRNCFKRGVFMTQEHLIEENRHQCGLHHPGNTVPACSECNGKRDKTPEGERLTWEQHLENIAKEKRYTPATLKERREKIKAFFDTGGYPKISPEEMAYISKTANDLYVEILAACTKGTRGFLAIHKESVALIRPLKIPKLQRTKAPSISKEKP